MPLPIIIPANGISGAGAQTGPYPATVNLGVTASGVTGPATYNCELAWVRLAWGLAVCAHGPAHGGWLCAHTGQPQQGAAASLTSVGPLPDL